MKTLSFIPLIAVLGCTDFGSPTQPAASRPLTGGQANTAQILNEKDDIVSFDVTACNGEPLLLDGTVHFRFDLVGPHNGNLMASFSADYKLRGLGPVTGAKYEAHQKITDHAVVTENVNVLMSDFTLRVVGQGKAPNSVLGFRTRIVIANGETRVFYTDVTNRCEP